MPYRRRSRRRRRHRIVRGVQRAALPRVLCRGAAAAGRRRRGRRCQPDTVLLLAGRPCPAPASSAGQLTGAGVILEEWRVWHHLRCLSVCVSECRWIYRRQRPAFKRRAVFAACDPASFFHNVTSPFLSKFLFFSISVSLEKHLRNTPPSSYFALASVGFRRHPRRLEEALPAPSAAAQF